MKKSTSKKHNLKAMTKEEMKQWNIDNPVIIGNQYRDKSEVTIFDIFCKATTKHQQP